MNAYFQVVNNEGGTKLRLIPATGDGEGFNVTEITDYLTYHKVPFQLVEVNKAVQGLKEETVISLCPDEILPIREEFFVNIKEDKMLAIARFMAPSSAGEMMDKNEILNDLKQRGIVFGVDENVIDEFLAKRSYCTNITIAKGVEPTQGSDATIEYFFNVDQKARPTLLEDGSVDFFHLNIINHCAKGDLLARLYPETKGEYGMDIMGTRIKPRDVKRKVLQYGHNIELSEDRTELRATDAGHVSLVDGRVFVSTLMEVENVDPSTGNIDYDGNVQINGNVCSGFKVTCRGNVEVKGVVEGAAIIAGGNITIARGMNGIGKGKLKAGGNIIAKFFENANVEAEGYVEAGSIMHSNVLAGTEVHVGGKRGFISGGYVSAASVIDVKTLGSDMGTDTVVEVGISPTVKKRYKELGDLIAEDWKVINRAVPILEAARDKLQAGKEISPEQIDTVRGLAIIVQDKRDSIRKNSNEKDELEELIDIASAASVVVHGTVYPGTKIVISDVSKIIKESFKYCKFERKQGDVRMVGL